MNSDIRQTDRRAVDRRTAERREELLSGFLAYVGTKKYSMADIDNFLDTVLGPESCSKRPEICDDGILAPIKSPRRSDRRGSDRRRHDRRKHLITDFLAYIGTKKYTELDLDEFLDDILGVAQGEGPCK